MSTVMRDTATVAALPVRAGARVARSGNRRSYEPEYSVNPAAGERRGVLLPLVVAFTVVLGARFKPSAKKGFVEQFPKMVQSQNLIAWGVMILVLAGVADIPTTSSLAIALAWLILITVLLTHGPRFINVLQTTMENNQPAV